MKCEICENRLSFRWTDSHGIGACTTCGAPYTIYHYDDSGSREDKPPELLVRKEWVPLTKRYWQETNKNCAPGCFNFPGSSYEVATASDFDSFHNWMDAHKSDHPVADPSEW